MNFDSDELLRLDNQLCFPLYAAARKMIGIYRPILKPLGITYTQYIAFMVLWEQDDISVGELGARLHLDNGTLTPLLKKMEASGYITRERRRDDERSVSIRLTQKGRDMKEKARGIPAQVGSCVDLPASKAENLYTILYDFLAD